MKIRLSSIDVQVHSPFLRSIHEFEKRGMSFIVGNGGGIADVALISHGLFQNKKAPNLETSTKEGLSFLKQIQEPYILIDGQDSPSLIGAYETFIESDALCLLKHTLLKDKELYKTPYVGGRYYWGRSEDYGVPDQNYRAKDLDAHLDKIWLAGTNWLGVQNFPWFNYEKIPKLFDIATMFGYPHPECHEFGVQPSQDFYYNRCRQPVMELLECSPFRVAKLYKGRRVPFEEYFQYIAHSKVILAPFGYGELATRDIESAQVGSILLKPDMSHLETSPNIYVENETYIPFAHDYSNLEAQMEYAVENFNELAPYLIENMKKKFDSNYHATYLVDHMEKIFKRLNIL